MSSLQQSGNQAIVNSVGATGSKAITGLVAVTPPTGYYFFAIQFLADGVVSVQSDIENAVNADLTSFTSISAGIVVYGKWDSITLTSGEAIGYLARI